MNSVIFDLDGTLVESAPDIRQAANRMLADHGLEPLDLPTIISFIGNGLPTLVERVIKVTDLDMADHKTLTQEVLHHYNTAGHDLTVPFPGVREVLISLKARGAILGVCTNKPESAAKDVLEHVDMAKFFDVVIGGDTLPVNKPDPAPLLAAHAKLGAGPMVYVGDSDVDAATAKAADVPFALFTEGYRKSPVAQLYHSASFADYADLPAIVERLTPVSA